MPKTKVFVGLDYHQHTVQVCVLDEEGTQLVNRICRNDAEEIIETVNGLGDRVFAAIEACSGAADLADELILQGGWSVDLAHAGYVARIKQSPDKTDYTDARLLADLERVGYLPKVWLAPQEVRELRRLVRFRQQLAKERRNIKLQLRAVLRDQRVKPPVGVNAWTRTWFAWVETAEGISIETRWIIGRQLKRLTGICEEIVAVEKHLAEVTADDPIVQKLLSYKGVGLITAATMRAEIGRFDRFRTGKQLARFCGLTPRNASSGQRQADAGIIKAGNPELRRVLIEAAHCLRRFDDRWHEFSERLKERGKPGNVIAAAVANRWVRGLFHEMVQLAA